MKITFKNSQVSCLVYGVVGYVGMVLSTNASLVVLILCSGAENPKHAGPVEKKTIKDKKVNCFFKVKQKFLLYNNFLKILVGSVA